MKRQWLIVLAVLFLTGCSDSQNPLSDPQTAKPDERLVGVWRLPNKDGVTNYHVGHAGGKFSDGVMRVSLVRHDKAKGEFSHGDGTLWTTAESSGEFLAFPTVLGEKTYLNVAVTEQQVKLLEEKGWKAVDSYLILKYRVDGDKMVVWGMDGDAKKRAIESGKVKGVIENMPPKFTDTTENVARFIAEAGDGLWNTKEPGQFERVSTHSQKIERRLPQMEEKDWKPTVPTPPLRPLVGNLMVDKNGIIWEWGLPVGIWDVDLPRRAGQNERR